MGKKQVGKRQEKYVAREVRRRLDASRREQAIAQQKANQRVQDMPYDVRMNYEIGKLVKHAVWLVDNAGIGWARVGFEHEQYIALMFSVKDWELKDDTLRRKPH